MQVLASNAPLPDTKSRRCRFYDLAEVTAEIADFVLVSRQGKPGLKEYNETAYMLQEVTYQADLPHGARVPGMVFLLAKIAPDADDENGHEVYECFVPAQKGYPGFCSCIGQKTAKTCRHLDALCDYIHGESS